MLFLYRPRETWMPFGLPRNRTEQGAYNLRLQQQFESTRRVALAVPAPAQASPIAELTELATLHKDGVLTDAEFETAKAKLLAR